MWMTERAAEYPEGLCDILASEFVKSTEAMREKVEPVYTEQGTVDPLERPTKRQKREAEDDACNGGLRNPHRSILALPGWDRVGMVVQEALGSILDARPAELSAVYEGMGREEAAGFGGAALVVARVKLWEALSSRFPFTTVACEARERVEDTGPQIGLLESLLLAAEDLERAVPHWLR